MSPQKKISIIIPCYNDANNLLGLLENLSNLKLEHIEIIIVDGNSSDNTRDVIDKYENLIHRFISEPDKGIYDAMNKGISIANGNFLYFLGSDDRLYPSFMDAIQFLKNNRTIYYGKVYNIFKKSWYEGIFTKKRLLKENLSHQSIFYPKSVFSKFQYDIKYQLMADYKLNIQLFGSNEFEKVYLNIPIAQYSGEGRSTTSREIKFSFFSYLIVLKNFGIKYIFIKIYFKIQSIL